MDIIYLGHSSFKLKGKDSSVITDPFEKKVVGFGLLQASSDIVTVSSDDQAHNSVNQVSGTSRRKAPYVVSAPGEYEVSGIGVFGWGNHKEVHQDATSQKNTIYSIIVDGVRVVHTGLMQQVISDSMAEDLGTVDVLLMNMCMGTTFGPKEAIQVVEKLSPSIVIPMHYKLPDHSSQYADLVDVGDFLKLMGVVELEAIEKLRVTKDSLPEGTQTVLLAKG